VTDQDRAAIGDLLETHNTATLATSGADGPWAAAVFFASDADLNLYFVSDPRTRHARDLAVCPEVAAAIHADCSAWAQIRGLQLAGRAEVLEGPAREMGLACYLAKFSDIKALLERPYGPDEEAIAKRLNAASLYRLAPHWIRLIDNGRGFGYKREIEIRARSGRGGDPCERGRGSPARTPFYAPPGTSSLPTGGSRAQAWRRQPLSPPETGHAGLGLNDETNASSCGVAPCHEPYDETNASSCGVAPCHERWPADQGGRQDLKSPACRIAGPVDAAARRPAGRLVHASTEDAHTWRMAPQDVVGARPGTAGRRAR
jgi:uncharacterized protein YhbP (UPF0306 family)